MKNINGFVTGEATFLFPGVSMYPVAILIGMIASIITIFFFWWKNNYQTELLLKLILITIPTSILGARLFFIFERLIEGDPSIAQDWYKIWEGGLSIHGGVILATVFDVLYLRTKRKVVDIRMAFSIILPTVLIGQAIGRWGNFANHEVYGAITSESSISWLGPTITVNMFIDGEFRQPLFFYESMANLFGYFVIVWIILYRGWLKPGSTGALYLIWYGVVRTAMEPLREEAYLFYTLLSVGSILLGLSLLFYFEKTGIKLYIKEKVNSGFVYKHKGINFSSNISIASSRWINE